MKIKNFVHAAVAATIVFAATELCMGNFLSKQLMDILDAISTQDFHRSPEEALDLAERAAIEKGIDFNEILSELAKNAMFDVEKNPMRAQKKVSKVRALAGSELVEYLQCWKKPQTLPPSQQESSSSSSSSSS